MKFYWNGIKAEGEKLWRAFYSDASLCHHPAGTLTIYARDYHRAPAAIRAAFQVENNSDMMTDYFETDLIRVLPGHPLYAQVRAALDAANSHRERHAEKRLAASAQKETCHA